MKTIKTIFGFLIFFGVFFAIGIFHEREFPTIVKVDGCSYEKKMIAGGAMLYHCDSCNNQEHNAPFKLKLNK